FMAILAAILTVLAALACLVWITRHAMIWIENRKGFTLTANYEGPPADAPMVSVVLAAKDEEENIGACVRTMLDQDYPNFEMIVVNDRSGDRTAEIVQEIAAGDARLKLINIESLPEGWCGKNNAMQTGIAASKGKWVCMIDADCRQLSRRTLSVAVQYAEDTKADFLSILPRLEMKGFWENVIQPVCSGVMMIWFHPDRVNDPKRRNAYANGAFMMMKRDTHTAIGTHDAVRMCLNEDMHLARLVKEGGHNLRVVRSGELFICRMYTTYMAMLRGWGRIFYGTFGTLRRLTATLAVLVIMGVLPYLIAALGLSLGEAGVAPATLWKVCGWVGVAACVMQITVIYRFYRLLGAKAYLAITYPLGALMAIFAVIISLTRLRKGAAVTWRGTSYNHKTTTPK
ncbi:MAG: glycosyltransferase, partial [Planctomycetaceae bacterium]